MGVLLVGFPDAPLGEGHRGNRCCGLSYSALWAGLPCGVLAVRLPGFPTTARCRVWRRIGWLHSVACSHVGARQVPEPAWGVKFVTRAVPAGPGSRREDSELSKERWPFGLARSRRAQLDLSKPKKEGQAMLKLFFSKAKFAGEKKPADSLRGF